MSVFTECDYPNGSIGERSGFPPALPNSNDQVTPFIQNVAREDNQEMIDCIGKLRTYVKASIGSQYPRVNLVWRSVYTELESVYWDLCLDVCIMCMYAKECDGFDELYAAATQDTSHGFLQAVHAIERGQMVSAISLGLHSRVGADSRILTLEPELVGYIIGYI